jgi:hypothetical protein
MMCQYETFIQTKQKLIRFFILDFRSIPTLNDTDRILSVYGTVCGTVLLCPRLRGNTVHLRP